jgi:hypothetical protein
MSQWLIGFKNMLQWLQGPEMVLRITLQWLSGPESGLEIRSNGYSAQKWF